MNIHIFRPPDLPDEKPRISGVQGSYQMHEDVIVNCSSPRSLPAATLAFYVNDEQVRQTAALSWGTKTYLLAFVLFCYTADPYCVAGAKVYP